MMLGHVPRRRVGHDPAGVPPSPVVVGLHARLPRVVAVDDVGDVVLAEGTRVEEGHPLAGPGGEATELDEGVPGAPSPGVGGGASSHPTSAPLIVVPSRVVAGLQPRTS